MPLRSLLLTRWFSTGAPATGHGVPRRMWIVGIGQLSFDASLSMAAFLAADSWKLAVLLLHQDTSRHETETR